MRLPSQRNVHGINKKSSQSKGEIKMRVEHREFETVEVFYSKKNLKELRFLVKKLKLEGLKRIIPKLKNEQKD